MKERKAVLLMTVYRRYHELVKNLARTLALARVELGYAPDVVLVWARPEIARLWLMQDLQAAGGLTHVVGRPALPREGETATTYPESVNIRKGFEFVAERYPADAHYVIFQAADVCPRPGTLHFVDHHMREHEAVLFHWQNACTSAEVWHTNFFALALDPAYWPPVSGPDDQDVLERQWGRSLAGDAPPGVYRWHNYEGKKFSHTHESEGLPDFPARPQSARDLVPLTVSGHLTRLARAWNFIKGFARGVLLMRG